jgi:hypothetical protein
MTERILRALGALCLLSTTACSAMRNCPEGTTDPVPVPSDHGAFDAEAFTYNSAGWGDDEDRWDHFPAKTKLRFMHHMGVIPLGVKVYLAFDDKGTNGKEAGSAAESAGNQDLLDCVDASVIEIKNDTCEDGFYARVIAWDAAPMKPDDPNTAARMKACE